MSFIHRTLRTFQRYGGYVILVGIAALILSWTQTVSSLANPLAGSVAAEAVPTPTAPAALLPFDAAAVPQPQSSDLAPGLSPFNIETQQPTVQFQTYVVQRNDTPNGIAEKFGIKPETLLGGNPQLSNEASLLQTDMELIILPVDGVLHTVRRGDTLESIAQKYDVSVEDIIGYEQNNLSFPFRLEPDSLIMVPGGLIDDLAWHWTPPDPPASITGRGLVPGTGTFVWPVSFRRITQTYWYGHRGLDIGTPEGTPVYTSDTGTVIWANWNITGYGNLIVVDHGNGYQTFYAHLSGYNVYVGQVVTQGQLIGWTGNTGNSSGPHIHFEIRLNGIHQSPFWPGYLQ